MCRDCYEQAGKPSVWNDKVARAVALIDTVYSWHAAAGLLHIVLDNWNVGDDILEYVEQCIREQGAGWSEDEPELMAATRELLPVLWTMTREERQSALAHYEGYVSDAKGK